MRPHIVIFNPDQFRADAVAHLGNPASATPVLDRLVREDAVSFGRAFCQNPVCTPSRCSFMTGWYPHVRGHRTMFRMLRSREGEPMLLDILRANGYREQLGFVAKPQGRQVGNSRTQLRNLGIIATLYRASSRLMYQRKGVRRTGPGSPASGGLIRKIDEVDPPVCPK